VSQIAQVESEFTGGGPIKGGPAGLFLEHTIINTRETTDTGHSDGTLPLVETDEFRGQIG
jgi:hypothetical protein